MKHTILIPGYPEVALECDNVVSNNGTTFFINGSIEDWNDGYGYTVLARLVGPVLVIHQNPREESIDDLE